VLKHFSFKVIHHVNIHKELIAAIYTKLVLFEDLNPFKLHTETPPPPTQSRFSQQGFEHMQVKESVGENIMPNAEKINTGLSARTVSSPTTEEAGSIHYPSTG